MNLFVTIGLVDVAALATFLLLAAVVGLFLRRRSRPRANQPEPFKQSRTVRILSTEEELADAVRRAIATEHQLGTKSTKRIRRYKRLVPSSVEVDVATGSSRVVRAVPTTSEEVVVTRTRPDLASA